MNLNQTIIGDTLTILKTLPDELVDCVVTSPPYWGLRDYGVEGQMGLEKTPDEYVSKMVEVFREVRRVLKKEGTCWLNLGDSYAGSLKGKGCSNFTEKQSSNSGSFTEPMPIPKGLKPKDLVGIPWRVAFALQADGWWLRQDIIWSKPNPMPESVTDRCTKSHEYVFLLTKSARYYFDNEAIKVTSSESYKNDSRWETGKTDTNYKKGYEEAYAQNPKTPHKVFDKKTPPEKVNKRSVWTVTTKPYSEAHFATFPEALIEPMIKAGCLADGIVMDCFMGSGTTGLVATKLNRKYMGIELNPDYGKLIEKRTDKVQRNLI